MRSPRRRPAWLCACAVCGVRCVCVDGGRRACATVHTDAAVSLTAYVQAQGGEPSSQPAMQTLHRPMRKDPHYLHALCTLRTTSSASLAACASTLAHRNPGSQPYTWAPGCSRRYHRVDQGWECCDTCSSPDRSGGPARPDPGRTASASDGLVRLVGRLPVGMSALSTAALGDRGMSL